MSTTTASLQDLCLAKCVQCLENYPPKLLACLPPTLRHMLLVHLPIVDICQLEDTCVFDGIDSNKIWDKIVESHAPQYFRDFDFFEMTSARDMSEARDTLEKVCCSSREKYLTFLLNLILNCERPSGYFANFVDTDQYFQPQKEVFESLPVDIVNYLVAGSKIHSVRALPIDRSYLPMVAKRDYDVHCDDQLHHDDVCYRQNCCIYKKINELFQFIPPRYDGYVLNDNSRLSDEDALTLLVEKCNHYADHLSVSVSAYSFISWNYELLSQLLKNVVSLELFFDEKVRGAKETEQLLMAILSSHTPKLTALSFRTQTLLAEDALLAIGDEHLSVLARLSLPSPSLLQNTSPLQSLEKISLCGVYTPSGLDNLKAVVSYQLTALKEFSLRGYSESYSCFEAMNQQSDTTGICSQHLADGLVSLFHSPNFQVVSLGGISISLALFEYLVVAFLTSPCKQAQTLNFDVEISDMDSSFQHCIQQKIPVPELAVQHKSLKITTTNLSTSTSSWLLSMQPLKLRSLVITCNKCHYSHHQYDKDISKLKHYNDVVLAAQNNSFHVESLSLTLGNSLSLNSIRPLLQNATLKHLKLTFSGPKYGMLAENLLSSQLSTSSHAHTFEELHFYLIVDTYFPDFNYDDDESLPRFLDTLFSLPFLDHISLTLETGITVYPQILSLVRLVHQCWKRSSRGNKLKMCSCSWQPSRKYGTVSIATDEHMLSIVSEMGLEPEQGGSIPSDEHSLSN